MTHISDRMEGRGTDFVMLLQTAYNVEFISGLILEFFSIFSDYD